MHLRRRLIGAAGALLVGAALWASFDPIEIARAAERSIALPSAGAQPLSAEAWLDAARDALYACVTTPGPEYLRSTAMGYNDSVVVLVAR